MNEVMPEGHSRAFIQYLKKNWIAVVALILSITSLSVNIYRLYLDYFVPERSDLRIILDPYDVIWKSNSDNATFSANGSLSNDGPRPAKVLRFTLSIVYVLPSGSEHILPFSFTNISRTWKVPNNPILAGAVVNFYLSVYIMEEFTVDKATGEVVPIMTRAPEKFELLVSYDDGMGSQAIERIYDFV